jgi:tetratricopeptide (TPR) repeat protein
MLDMLSWFAPEPLPRFLFDHGAVPGELRELFQNDEMPREILRELSGDPEADPEEALASLRDFSLLQPAKETKVITEGQVHRVLALMTRERQSEEEQTRSLKSALALVNAAAVGSPNDVRHWPLWNPLRPHILALVDAAEKRGISDPTGRLLNDIAMLLAVKAEHVEAEPPIRRALAIDEKAYGADHPEVAIDFNNLAGLLKATNRLAEAEPLMRRALAIDENSYGADHPDVAIDLNNLAQLLKATNRLAEAEPLMRRALLILLKFTRSTSYPHPHLNAALGNYRGMLEAMSLSEDEIDRRVADLRREAGLD